MNKKIEIMFRRRGTLLNIFKEKTDDEINYSEVFSFVRNIEAYGYTFSTKALEYLSKISTNNLSTLNKDFQKILKEAVGEGQYMTPLYPDFPKVVMDSDEATLFYNALKYWSSNGEIIEELKSDENKKLFINENPLKVIDISTKEDYFSIFNNLLSGKGILSETDKEDILYFIKHEKNIINYIPERIYIKETLAYFTSEVLKELDYDKNAVNILTKLYKTSTDVLRLCKELLSVKKDDNINIYYRSPKRKERKFLLNLLENCGNIEEDMFKHKSEWIRLGEKLHPAEYKNFKKVNIAFNKIRNNPKSIKRFNSLLNKAFESKDIETLISLLSTRPGEFARNLARVVRIQQKEGQNIINAFSKVADKVSTPLLLDVAKYFKGASKINNDNRVFFSSGNLQKAYFVENKLEVIDVKIADELVSVCENAFINNIKDKSSLGKVYIDDDLEQFIVPMKNRTASKQLNFVSRGTSFKLSNNSKFVVPFIYWKEPVGEQVDLDLSAVLMNKNFESITDVTYYSLKDSIHGCYHSGDERSAPNGAIEAISINRNLIEKSDVCYIAITIHSYTNTPFSELPECYVGYMERTNMFKGNTFEPTSVVQKSDLITNNQTSLSCLYDIKNKKIIWTDFALMNDYLIDNLNNVNSTRDKIVNTMKLFLNYNKPNMLELAKLEFQARGTELVSEKYLADTIFSTKREDIEDLLSIRKEKRIEKQVIELKKQASLIYNAQNKKEKTLKEIYTELTNIQDIENKQYEKESINCISPFDVDIIVSSLL